MWSQNCDDCSPEWLVLQVATDKLRKNIDATEYKHIVLGLIFLKYISDAFDVLHDKLLSGAGDYAGADPEDRFDRLEPQRECPRSDESCRQAVNQTVWLSAWSRSSSDRASFGTG